MPRRGETGSKYRKVKISNEKIRQRNKKEYAKIIVLAAFLLVITIGGSYALFQTTIKGNKQTEVVAGILKVEYEDKNTISLNNASPLTDVEGLNQEPYTFTVRNIGTLNGKYTIYLEEKEGNTLDKSNIKYSIKEGEGDWSSPVLLSSGLVLKENRILEKGEEETYQIKMWLKEDATNEVQGQTYKAKVVVNVVQTNTENIVTTNPVIKLNGESVVKINQNEEYVDAGVSSVSSREEISLDKVKVRYEYNNGETTESVEKIDTSKVGIYYIYYEVEDSKGIKGISTRVVNVVKKGTNTPTIVLKGEEEISLDYKEKYVEAGYEARDVEDGELTDKVVVEGVVNSEVAGTYIIKYIVIDSEGNTASVVRKVIVNGKSQGLTATVKKEEEENISTTVTIEADSESEKAYYAVTTTDKKPGDSEYKELVNKKVSLNIVKNGRYYIFVKDSKGNVVKKTVDITNIDETKPSCSFEDGGYVEKGKTKEIELTCTDPADIATTKIETERIEVSDSEVGEVESISIGEKINKGYKYKVTVRGKESGNFTIKLKGNSVLDKVGNKNEEVESSSIKVVSMDVGTSEIELDLTGTTEKQIEISGTNIGKLSYESNNKEIAIVTEEGIVKAVSPGVTTITVTEANSGITLKINVAVFKTIAAHFVKNGTGVSDIEKVREECKIKDSSGKCSLTLPGFTTINGYKIIGWGVSKTATEGISPATEVTISEDTTYYSISGKTLTATFIKNGATSLDGSTEEKIQKSCTLYNSDESCEVISPTIVGTKDTPIIIGFSTEADNHVSTWSHATIGNLTSDATYYAQTKSTEKDLTSKFMISSLDKVTKIENSNGINVTNTTDALEEKCQVPGTYNGNAQATSCEVTTPLITVATGYKNGYWNKSISATTGLASGSKVEISDNDIYYANAVLNQYKVTYDYKTNGGTAVSKESENFTIGTAIDLTPTATKAGYTFVGWNTDKTATTALSSIDMGNSDITLYAIYSKSIEATFYYYNGTIQATEKTSCTVYNNDASCSYTVPNVVKTSVGPSNSTYKGVSASLSSTTPTTDYNSLTTKYYAYYENVWNLTYAKGAGVDKISKNSDSCTSQKTTDGTAYKETTCTVDLPTITAQTGYTVEGWYNASDSKVTSPYTISKTETLTSKTNINKYTVTYDYKTNGGTSATKNSEVVNYGGEIDLTPTATKTGYTFVGWNTDRTATTALPAPQVMKTSNVTLYAIYRKEAITYTAKFSSNGATLSSIADQSCTIPAVYNNAVQSTSCTVIAPTITRSGYTVVGYNTTASATQNNANYVASTRTLTLSSSGTWYAITSKNAVATFYYYNGSTQATTTASCTMYNTNSNCSITIPSSVSGSSGPNSTKYAGISTSANSRTAATNPTTINGNVTYYAYYQTAISATFYYYNGSAQATTTASGTRSATTNKTSYTVSNGSITVPSTVSGSSGPSSTKYAGVSTAVSSTSGTTPTTATTTYYAYYQAAISATFYYYNGSAQATTTASGTRSATTNKTSYTVSNGSITVPSTVSGSSGPSSTKYAGVSTAVSSTSGTTPTTATTTYYAYYQAAISATFYYYNGSAQATTTASGTRSATTNKTSYTVSNGSITVPSAVSSSAGPNSATYQGVSTAVSSTSTSAPTTAYQKYYAVYKGKWTITFQKGTNISAIGSTSASCDSYKLSNGTAYSSTSCTVSSPTTFPTITAIEGYAVDGWRLSTSTENSYIKPGTALPTLSSDLIYNSYVHLAVASEVSYNNNQSGLLDKNGDNCTDVQCAIDSINRIIE